MSLQALAHGSVHFKRLSENHSLLKMYRPYIGRYILKEVIENNQFNKKISPLKLYRPIYDRYILSGGRFSPLNRLTA